MISRLRIERLCLGRGERRLFAGLDLAIDAGEAVALAGANGSGKTTLLRAVAGLVRPAAGTVRFDGPAGAVDAEAARREGLHLVGHRDGLKGDRPAGDELAFQARWTGCADPAAIAAAAARLGLAGLLALPVRVLSEGQRRRLALARLLASPRPLWLLDEPLAPLDGEHRTLFAGLAEGHLAAGGLILAAVHDPLPLAARTVRLGE